MPLLFSASTYPRSVAVSVRSHNSQRHPAPGRPRLPRLGRGDEIFRRALIGRGFRIYFRGFSMTDISDFLIYKLCLLAGRIKSYLYLAFFRIKELLGFGLLNFCLFLSLFN